MISDGGYVQKYFILIDIVYNILVGNKRIILKISDDIANVSYPQSEQ